MPEIIWGSAGCGKSRIIYEKMGLLAKEGKKSLLIVPENMSHTAERRLLMSCGNAVSRYASVSTFTRITNRLLTLSADTAPSLDEGGRVLSMFRAVSEAESRLTYYKGAFMRPKLISAMLQTADELIASGADAEKLYSAADSPDMGDKIRDIAAIFDAYLAVCAQSRLDPVQLLDRAKTHIGETGFFKDVHVFIDDFSGFSEQKYSFLSMVLEHCADMTVSVLYCGDPLVFTEQRKMRDRFTQMGRTLGKPFRVTSLPDRPDRRQPELSACERVFDMTAPPLNTVPSALSVYAASSLSEECELCAAWVRYLVFFKGARLRDIAVVSGNMDEYTGMLEGFFRKYNIPAFFSRRESILKKPVLAAALGPLNVLREDMSISSLFSYLKCGFSRLSDEDIYTLENYALTWNIRGGAWLKPFRKSTGGFEKTYDDEPERLSRLEENRRLAVSPIEALKVALSSCKTGDEYAAAFEKHLEESGFGSAVSSRIEELEKAEMTQEAAECAQLYEILQNALTQMKGVLFGVRMDGDEFYSLLSLTLSQYDVSSIPSSLDAVSASSLTALSSDGVRHLIIIGARDGLLPPDVPQKSILTDSERTALEAAGIRLTSDSDKALELQSDIYRAVSAPTETLTFTYPLSIGSDTECSESYIISRIHKLLPKLEKKQASEFLSKMRLSAKTPLLEQACAAFSSTDPGSHAALEHLRQDNAPFFDFLRDYSGSPSASIRDKNTIRRLYGDSLYVSPSKVELISSCRFAFFCKYGLRAEKRPEYRLQMTQLGTMVHYVAEQGIKELCQKGGEARSVARRLSNEYIDLHMRDADSPRMRSLLARFIESIENILADLWDEIENSDFKPKYFEMRFSENGDAPPLIWEDEGFRCVLQGVADRVDFYGKYIKLIDYKTGTKVFSLDDLLNGHNLQMFIYMALLTNAGLGEGAAALYIPAKSEYVSISEPLSSDQIQKKKDEEVSRKGVMRSEPEILAALEHGTEKPDDSKRLSRSVPANKEQLYAITDFCIQKVRELSSFVLRGDTSVAPAGPDACTYCDYRLACHFDETDGKHFVRPLIKSRDAMGDIVEHGHPSQKADTEGK